MTTSQQPNHSNPTEAEDQAALNSPSMKILAQYVRDLSFENPQAPASLRSHEKNPDINVNINVSARSVSENQFDVILQLEAKSMIENEVLFNVELAYGGLFEIVNVPQEHISSVLFVECPRILFPFARHIMADATRNGGFPPLMLDPINFNQLFQQAVENNQQKASSEQVPDPARPN